jgi:hypothetical protein
MKMITTKAHAFIDYTTSIMMITAPWALGFTGQPLAAYTLIVSGIITIIHSLATDYEGGIINQIKMQQHLRIDIITGVLLAICPLLFHMDVIAPHIIMGLFKVCIAFVSQTVPSYKGYHGFTYKKFEKFPSMKY